MEKELKADSPSPSPHSASPAENALPPLLALFAGAMLLATLYLVFMWVPTERTMGIVQRIFYFKVGSAFVFIIGFVIGGVAAILYLVKREDRYDDLSVACNEVSLIFAVTVMIMGALWAKPAWGIYWAVRDPKLMATLMLALIYTAYLILRQSVSEPNQRAVVCAVVSIIGMVDIPFVYKANEWFRTQHPAPVLTGEGSIDPSMRFVLYFTTVSLLVLFWCLVRARRRLERDRRSVEGLRRRVLSL